MHRDPVWKNHRAWACLDHVPPITLPASATKCWMRGCGAHRPAMDERPEEEILPEPKPTLPEGVELCAWEGCTQHARPGSKYCSRRCSNRNARKRFRERNRDAA